MKKDLWINKSMTTSNNMTDDVPLKSYYTSLVLGEEIFSLKNMFPTIRNLQICVHASSPLLWRLINFRLLCSDDCRSWPCDEKINNHGCWGKHAHSWQWLLRNLSVSCRVNHFLVCNYSDVVHTEYIFTCIQHFFHQLNSAHER